MTPSPMPQDLPAGSGLAAAMDRMRAAHPGCSLLAFADLDARLVLSVSAARRPSQEHLETLCAEAAGLLAQLPSGLPGGGIPDRAMVLHPDERRLFLRSPHEPGEALILCARAGTDHESLCAAGMQLLGSIGAAR